MYKIEYRGWEPIVIQTKINNNKSLKLDKKINDIEKEIEILKNNLNLKKEQLNNLKKNNIKI